MEATDPNPKPAHEEDSSVVGGIYSNDIETYSSAAGHFVLTDTTRRSTNPSAYFLEAWQLLPTNDDFQWVASVEVGALGEDKNTHSVSVHGNHAFVGAEDLFFVVDLSNLPTFAPCESSTTCQRSPPVLSVPKPCVCSRSRRFARTLVNRSG